MRRRTAIPTLAAALKALEDWKVDAEMPDPEDGHVVDYHIQYVWFDPSGCEREVTEEQLQQKGNGSEEWPYPGRYEIRILDSNDDVLIRWEAEHVTPGSLSRSPAESPMALMEQLCHSAETQVRNTQYRLEKAERREEEAQKKLHVAQEQVAKLQREIAAAIIAKEAAIGDKTVAEARQKELQAAYDELEEQVSVWKPQVQMAVDHAMDRFGEMLFGMKPRNANAQSLSSGGEPPREDWDPPPENLIDAEVIDQEIFSLFFDLDRLQVVVERGLMSWGVVRSVFWHKTKRDLGAVPQWEQWRAERDGVAAEAAE